MADKSKGLFSAEDWQCGKVCIVQLCGLWIQFDCMRIRIQVKNITKLIQNIL